MRHRVAAAAAIAALAWAGPALSEEPSGFYFELAPGATLPLDSELDGGVGLEADTGFDATGAIGYGFNGGARLEFEVSFRRNELSQTTAAGTAFGVPVAAGQPIDGDQSFVVWMLNGYYDIPLEGRLVPYIGAGAGGVRVALESSGLALDVHEAGFAYQGLAGVRYRISPNVWARLGYGYFATDELAFAATDASFASHVVELGLAIGFRAF
jgi:opacity protein-like surface antigen